MPESLVNDSDLPPAQARRKAASEWLMTLHEPLLSSRRRRALDAAMEDVVFRYSPWAVNWFAGLCVDVAATLPPSDPWRHLAGTVDLVNVAFDSGWAHRSVQREASEVDELLSVHSPRNPAAPPEYSGALLPSLEFFGTVADAADIVPLGVSDPTVDISLAALTVDLPALCAGISAFAAAGDVARLREVLELVYHQLFLAQFAGELEAGASSATVFLDVVGTVLRRFVHRRRIYTGHQDLYLLLLGPAWTENAEACLSAPEEPLPAGSPLRHDAQLTDADYVFMTSFTRD